MNMKFSDEKYRLRTIEKDEEYLRSLSLDVLKDYSNLNEEIKVLSNYCRSNGNLIALASIQIGIPKKIIYISCNPVTMARDISYLTDLSFLV